jgi:hypothetical protein
MMLPAQIGESSTRAGRVNASSNLVSLGGYYPRAFF